MDPATAKNVVHDVLKQIQAGQKLDCPPLNDTTRPICDLARFDSPMSLAATGMVGTKLGIAIPPETNIFGDKNGKFTIGKTVGLLCKLSDEQKEAEAA